MTLGVACARTLCAFHRAQGCGRRPRRTPEGGRHRGAAVTRDTKRRRVAGAIARQGRDAGVANLIRIFKSESELEIWKQKDDGFILFATYPICHWSGSIGPKLRDGDRQAPEGYYTVTRAQARHVGRWPVSLDIGFPNILDQSQARTGFEHPDPWRMLVGRLLCDDQSGFRRDSPAHDGGDRCGRENRTGAHPSVSHDGSEHGRAGESPWMPFWNNLKEGYDMFERTKRPPAVSVCSGRYIFRETSSGEFAGPLDACGPTTDGHSRTGSVARATFRARPSSCRSSWRRRRPQFRKSKRASRAIGADADVFLAADPLIAGEPIAVDRGPRTNG